MKLLNVLLIGLSVLLLVVFSPSALAAGQLLYAVQNDTSTLGIIDATSNGVITNINVGYGISWILANPAGTYLYISDSSNNKISVLNPATNAIIKSISIKTPAGMAITSDGRTMYAAMYDDDKVAIIDLGTNTITGYVTVGDAPYAVAITPNDGRVFVTNYIGNTTSVISTSTNTVVYTMSPMNGPCDIAFSNDGTKVFILLDNHDTANGIITVFSATSNVYITSINMDHKSYHGKLELETDGLTIWATDVVDNEVTSYNTNTYAKISDITFPSLEGTGVCDIKATSSKLYISQSNIVRVYDLTTDTITANITTNLGILCLELLSPSDTSVIVSPQLVTFTAKTGYRTLAVTGLNVSVYDNSTGVLLYSGITDSTGSVNFVLTPTTKYDVLFNQSPNINTYYYVTPSYTGYIVDIPFGQVVGLTSWSDQIYNPPGEEISWTLAHPYNSTTGAGSLTPTYNDDGTVSSVTFSFYQNASFGEADTLLENQTPAGTGSWTYTENLASATGNSYYVIITVVKPDGTHTYVSGLAYTFPGAKVLAGVFPADWYFWIGWAVCLCFYAVGTVTKKGLFAVFGAAMGFIMAKWGWYSLVFPDTIAYLAIGFTFIIAVVVTIIERERYT